MQRFQINAFVVTVVLAGWAVLVGFVPPIAAGMRINEDFSGIPKTVGGWTSTDEPYDKTTLAILPTCSLLGRTYTDPSTGNSVNLSVVYGRDLGDFHQPEICMNGSGWKLIRSRIVEIHPKGLDAFSATAVTMTNDLDEIVMVYWFYMAGKLSSEMGSKKIDALRQALFGQGLEPSAMVKFTSAVITDEDSARETDIKMCEELTQSIVNVVSRVPKYEPSDKILK